jgi:hypothetical protein
MLVKKFTDLEIKSQDHQIIKSTNHPSFAYFVSCGGQANQQINKSPNHQIIKLALA